MQYVPYPEQIGNDRHGKNDDPLHRDGNVVNKSRDAEQGQRDQQKGRWHRDSRHISAQVRMVIHKASFSIGGTQTRESVAGRTETCWRSDQSTPSRTRVHGSGERLVCATPRARGPDGVQCSPGATIAAELYESGGRRVRSFPYPCPFTQGPEVVQLFAQDANRTED